MSKVKTAFICQSCGSKYSKWIGKCSACNQWNTIVEEVIEKSPANQGWQSSNIKISSKAHLLTQVESFQHPRITLTDLELSRVLGGGLVPGSVNLIGGEPGIGKSTLMLQLGLQQNELKVLYISGEESEQQIKLRAERIGIKHSHFYILTETSTQKIFKQIEEIEPDLLIIDSIQTLYTAQVESSPGSVTQIRECANEIIRFAKETSTPVFLIGHITKDGLLAGPKVLEHMVDVVVQFEGDRHHVYRILRTLKNRFGSTSEIGIYEMLFSGLREVSNPSEILIGNRSEAFSGISIAATLEGIRPLLIEIQALVSSAVYGIPQRSATGFDLRRMSMLLAVLEKRCGFKLAAKDVFLNIAGGIKVDDPAIDLAVICAVLSSTEDIPISPKLAFSAEIGLSGEIRPVNRIEQRISEAEKLGFQQIFISRYNEKGLDLDKYKIKVIKVGKVEEVFSLLFG
jgi:DNA repair protein RadA/Sms